MHSYRLHHPVIAECLCCRRSVAFRFKSKSDQVVCEDCLKHIGDGLTKAKQRDADHVRLWFADAVHSRAESARQISLRDGRIAELQGEVNELKSRNEELGVALLGDLRRNPEALRQLVTEHFLAETYEERQRAYRARDRAMRELFRVYNLHHEVERQECVCGKPIDRCDVGTLIEENVSWLREWERNQIERARKNLPHGLPYEHPENRDAWHRYAS